MLFSYHAPPSAIPVRSSKYYISYAQRHILSYLIISPKNMPLGNRTASIGDALPISLGRVHTRWGFSRGILK